MTLKCLSFTVTTTGPILSVAVAKTEVHNSLLRFGNELDHLLNLRVIANVKMCCHLKSKKLLFRLKTHIVMTLVELTLETIPDETAEELKVTFYPQLYLQRRMWILDIMRVEKVTKVLDIGCGEGQLLAVLCQPAPWLSPPPAHVLSTLKDKGTTDLPLSLAYNEEIPNIHPTYIMGLDISTDDLEFAVKSTAPPQSMVDLDSQDGHNYSTSFTSVNPRWENLDVKIWKGGLEAINQDFIDIECIVSTEVIEHLSPDILPAFAPVIMGVYHPRLFLITTPSYTFNARFTAPMAPASARKGYLDPTRRTDRVFRHSDHKFEWTTEEFQSWCHTMAEEWGYEVKISSVGRAVEADEWGRDAVLGGASSVAVFRRRDMEGREIKGRQTLQALKLSTGPHELLKHHRHLAHPSSEKPCPLKEIARNVKEKMEDFREGFMRLEELWFEQDISILCGGWIEILVRAVEESDLLILKKSGDGKEERRGDWVVELVDGIISDKVLWPTNEDTSLYAIPFDWNSGDGEAESSGGEWGGSTDMDGDISLNESEEDDDMEDSFHWSQSDAWSTPIDSAPGRSGSEWGTIGWDKPDVSSSEEGVSTTGWDGDESEDTN